MPEHAYTISQDEIERLRRQIGDLKRNPAKEPIQSHAMIESMDRLYEALSRLIVILENANRAMAQDALQGIKDEHAKLDKLLEQNEKIARGIVALADLTREQRTKPSLAAIQTATQQPMASVPSQPLARGAESFVQIPSSMPALSPQTPVSSPSPLQSMAIQPPTRMQAAASLAAADGLPPPPLPKSMSDHSETSFLAQPVAAVSGLPPPLAPLVQSQSMPSALQTPTMAVQPFMQPNNPPRPPQLPPIPIPPQQSAKRPILRGFV